ncbi:phage tail protein [Pantanalinema rosaneae CENA516]|uniref:phage tail protein n=1 Tax=Pantanalinema rosaneae TaxID=1620701 RepID=UPI003D6EC927
MPMPGFTTNTSRYYVEFDGLTQMQIKSMTEITYEAKVAGNKKAIAATYRPGGGVITERQTTSGGYETNPTMTIEVYMSGHQQSASYRLYRWFQSCLPTSDGGRGDWANNRKTASVVLYDADGKTEVLRWNLDRAWIKKYSISAADVTGGELAVETYEFVAEHIDKESQVQPSDDGRIASSEPVTSRNAF